MPTAALRTAASGMNAQQVNIQVIANNIANINTTGFKKNRAEFQDLIYQDVVTNPQSTEIPGAAETTNSTVEVGSGVRTSSTQKIFTQGALQQTSQQLDIGINGDGFFQLRKPDGTFVYTRDGSFKLSADGTIVSSSGHILEPGFTIDGEASEIHISKQGNVSLVQFNGDKVDLGNIDIVKFVNPAGLKSLGDNLYAETSSSGQPLIGTPGSDGYGEVHQGFLESSNVDIVQEMVNMITAQRSYEINSKTIKSVEDMLSIANNLKR